MPRDNSNFMAKVKLRRFFLSKYFEETPIKVFETCQGEGTMWDLLSEEFHVEARFGVDIKEKAGRVAIDAKKMLGKLNLDKYNIIDIDPYGTSFEMYEEALSRIKEPKIFFLTCGSVGVGFTALSKLLAKRVGFFEDKLDFQFSKTLIGRQIIPPAIFYKVTQLGAPYCVQYAYEMGFTLTDFVESQAGPTAKYYGVRVIPVGWKETSDA